MYRLRHVHRGLPASGPRKRKRESVDRSPGLVHGMWSVRTQLPGKGHCSQRRCWVRGRGHQRCPGAQQLLRLLLHHRTTLFHSREGGGLTGPSRFGLLLSHAYRLALEEVIMGRTFLKRGPSKLFFVRPRWRHVFAVEIGGGVIFARSMSVDPILST